MLDPLELFAYSVTPICFSTAEYVGQGDHPNPATWHPVSSDTDNGNATQLFGMNTEPVTVGALFDKWQHARSGIDEDLAIVARCETQFSCPTAARKLIGLSLEGDGRSERARIGLINRAVDLAISPVSDEAQWGVADHWSDPLETLQSDRGDCEDYAIVKYAALIEAGFSRDDLRIVIFKQRVSGEYHAVGAARVNDAWLLLDNLTLTLVRDSDVTRSIPEFVLGEDGVRRFVSGNQDERTAS